MAKYRHKQYLTLGHFFSNGMEDFIRLRKEFEYGRFELEISNKQTEWLYSILKGFSTYGMNSKCDENTAKFIEKMFDLLNAMGY